MSVTLYDQIILLDETTGTGKFIGLLYENDDNTPVDDTSLLGNLVSALTGKSEELKKEIESFQKYREDLKKSVGKKFSIKQIASFIKLVSLFIMRGVGFGIEKIFNVLDWIWSLIKKIPGVETISKKLYEFFFVNFKGQVRTFRIGNKQYPVPQVIKAVISGLVLGALSGKLIALIKQKYLSKHEESVDIITEPLIIPFSESDEGNIPADTFVKRSPGILSRILNFLSNIKDEAMKLIVGTIALLVTISIFFAILLGLRPIICKTIRYTAAVRKIKAEHHISPKGFSAVKLGVAQIITSMIEMLEKRNILSGYVEMCDCVQLKNGVAVYTEKNTAECTKYFNELLKEIQSQQPGAQQNKNKK